MVFPGPEIRNNLGDLDPSSREEVRAFRGSSNSPEELVARKEEWIQEVLENPYTTYLDENSPDQIFKWFLEQIHRPLRRGVAVEKRTFLENVIGIETGSRKYVAGSRVAMFIVESDRVDQNNRMLWDLVLGKDLPERRRRLAESLNAAPGSWDLMARSNPEAPGGS